MGLRPGLRPGPLLGSLQRSPDLLAGFKGAASRWERKRKGKEGEVRRGEGKGRRGAGRGRERRLTLMRS